MDLLNHMVGTLGTNALKDTAKLVVLGSTVEAARRGATSAWSSFVDSFFLTAHFSQEDYPYDWIMHWLAKQPSYAASREFDVGSARTTGIAAGNDLEEEEDDSLPGMKRTAIQFLPSFDIQHSIFYHGHWLKIVRTRRGSHGYSELKISVVARNNNILKQLVLQARREYELDMEHRVHVYLAEGSSWRWNGAQKKRPLSSVVLEPGVKDMLIADAKDFLASEAWYADRGIPYRRGYLLYGVPGSGKTSLIHAIAGELSLDIYVVSLSAKGMSDNTLNSLLARVPSRCILLLEDLDAAFTKSVTRDAKSTGVPTATGAATAATPLVTVPVAAEDANTLSLSGLLNSLDGVAAATGRLLFATTNHYERLDAALTRPGRLDVHVDFKHASRWQAEGIFKNFYPTKPKVVVVVAKDANDADADSSTTSSTTTSATTTKKAVPSSPKQSPHQHVIPQLEEEEIAELAKRFAAAIPEDEMSVAGLQGYLLKNKTRPREAVNEVHQWIEKERDARAKLKKLKEDAAVLEAEEEKAAKEKIEKEAAELLVAAAAAKAKEEVVAAADKDKVSKKKRSKKAEVTKEESSDSEPEVATPAAAVVAATTTPTAVVVPAPTVVAVPTADTETKAELSSSESSNEPGSSTSSDDASVSSDSSATSDDIIDLERSIIDSVDATTSSAKWVDVKTPKPEVAVVSDTTAIVPAAITVAA